MKIETRKAVIQNLKDAGCSLGTIKDFLSYFDRGQREEQLELLKDHRTQLLNRVHKEEKKISCLDYLIDQLKK